MITFAYPIVNVYVKNMTCLYMSKARRYLLKGELKNFMRRLSDYRMNKLVLG